MDNNEIRWYDRKNPSRRSFFELLFYNCIAAPIIRKRFRKTSFVTENEDILSEVLFGARIDDKAVVIVANHIDEEDTTFVPYMVDRAGSFCYKIAKTELFENFWERLKMYWVGARPIDRNAGTRDLWIIKKLIQDRKVILTFPTGHRDPENKTPVNIGIPMVIHGIKDKVIVLPIRLVDTDKFFTDSFIHPQIIIKEPINMDSISPRKEGIFQIMESIAKAIEVPMTERKKPRIKE